MTFLDILTEYNVPYKQHGQTHHSTIGFVQIDCPYCSPKSSHWRMGYSIEGKFTTCWQCGWKPLAETLSLLTDEPMAKCYALANGLPVSRVEQVKHKGTLKLPRGVGPLLPAHKRYLESRGFDPAELEERWGIRGIGQAALYQWRLFIPIIWQGETVSWTTRTIGDKGKRYMNAPTEMEAVPAKTLLYGEDFCQHAAIVVEGPLDAIAIGPGAVATMGLVVTEEQIRRLAEYSTVAVCFDDEPDAQRRANALRTKLDFFGGSVKNVTLETGSDPAEAEQEEIEELRQLVFGRRSDETEEEKTAKRRTDADTLHRLARNGVH